MRIRGLDTADVLQQRGGAGDDDDKNSFGGSSLAVSRAASGEIFRAMSAQSQVAKDDAGRKRKEKGVGSSSSRASSSDVWSEEGRKEDRFRGGGGKSREPEKGAERGGKGRGGERFGKLGR